MDPHAAVIEHIVAVVVTLQDTLHGLSQRIDRQQAPQLSTQEDSQFDMGEPPPPPPPPPSMAQMAPPPIPQGNPVVIQRSTEVAKPHATIPIHTIGASDDHIQRVEQMPRQLRFAEDMDVWDGFDSAPVTPLLPKFWMPDMERYTGRGCPRTHLRIYSHLMRGMGLDEAQLIMLFPLLLSSVAQSWFSTLDASRRQTWEALAHEFIRRFSFSTIIDVTRRELEAMREGAHEAATSFISIWREKVIQMIDRPSKREQISMIMRILQLSYARHLMGVPIMDYRALIEALYGIEDGMARGLWLDSSSSDSKGKKPSGSYRPGEVGAISSFRHGAPRPQYASIRPHRASYAQSSIQYRPSIPPQPLRLLAPYTPPHPIYAAQVMERPPIGHLRPRAPTVPTQQPRQLRHFTSLGMP